MSTLINDGGPAFPRSATKGTSGTIVREAQDGMTLRDYFAGQAVSGLYADNNFTGSHVDAAKCSYALADAMLKAREAKS